MYSLTNKTILIISQQSWGKMFVSKHHYASELAKRGNQVYFLNPPNYEHLNFSEMIEIAPSDLNPNLFILTDNITFPFNIKFHFIGLFHLLIRRHVKSILKKIGKPIDIVWSFDLAFVYPFKFFPKHSLKIFHPVDDPLNQTNIDAARGAQYIFSTANSILDKYAAFKVPKKFINHGIASEFLEAKKNQGSGNIKRVGFSGNLLREDIDRPTLLKIIEENREIIFECWGSYEIKDANVGGGHDSASVKFINDLKSNANVILHGTVSAAILANELNSMDAFLICYDLTVENRNGPNYHKLMEYISTGKIIISNYISVYSEMPWLVQMVSSQSDNLALPDLFKRVVGELEIYNTAELQQRRLEFASDNTYVKQINRIEEFLEIPS